MLVVHCAPDILCVHLPRRAARTSGQVFVVQVQSSHEVLKGKVIVDGVSGVLPRQEDVDLCEIRSLSLDAVPALDHQIEDLPWAERRTVQVNGSSCDRVREMSGVVDHLFFGEAAERKGGSEGEDLPEDDSKRPDITLNGESTLNTDASINSFK